MKTVSRGDRGAEVRALQRMLGITADGIFGPQTESVLKEWQYGGGLVADGICGPKTWAALTGLAVTDAPISVHVTRSAGRQVRYIAIHYTAGATSRRGAALATRGVFLQRSASADFVVDDETVVQVNPDIGSCYCWAVGDRRNPYGASLYGKATNKNTVSIEICSNLTPGTTAAVPNHAGWHFTEAALENALRLVRWLMAAYGVPRERVVRHFDITGKPCPGIVGWNDAPLYTTGGRLATRRNDSGEWERFRAKI